MCLMPANIKWGMEKKGLAVVCLRDELGSKERWTSFSHSNDNKDPGPIKEVVSVALKVARLLNRLKQKHDGGRRRTSGPWWMRNLVQ